MDFVFSCILGRHRVTSKIKINMNLKFLFLGWGSVDLLAALSGSAWAGLG